MVYLPTGQNILLLMTRLNHHSYDVEFESQTRWYFEDINREIKQLTGLGRVSVSSANNSEKSYCLCNGACGTS